ncbi:MAG: alpha/beta fold hydrolase [Candidatus Obscuribacterales bacterium]|nr:alpha/beta fold hydrolase [Candidatus Obscuribacterales bacterium]
MRLLLISTIVLSQTLPAISAEVSNTEPILIAQVGMQPEPMPIGQRRRRAQMMRQAQNSAGAQQADYPAQGSQGYPAQVPAQGYQTQGYPMQGIPGQAYPMQGNPAQGYPMQGIPAQGYPMQGIPAQGYPMQGIPAQAYPTQNYPMQGAQGYPMQNIPAQGYPAPSYQSTGYQMPGAMINQSQLPPISNPSAAAGKSESKKDDSDDSDKKDDKHKGKVRGDAPCVSWTMFGIPTRAVLLCIHGLGLHSESFDRFGKAMSSLGVATYAIDVRGFGSWMDAKGHKNVDFKACIEDVKTTLGWLRRANPNKPIFVLGESMGGAIAIHSAAQFPELMTGMISACASGDRFQQKKTDLSVAFHALLGPNRKFDIGKKIVDQAAGDNAQLEQQWKDDPLNKMELSPLELMQFQGFMNDNHDEAKKITSLPVLIVQGSKDGLVKPEGTQELYDEMPTKDKTMIYVANAEHLIFEEGQCTDKDILGVAKWIFAHCPQSAQGNANLPDLLAQAKTLMESGSNDEALKILQGAAEISPQDPNVHYLMGLALYHNKHFKAAMQNFMLVRRFGQGTAAAADANRMMMAMPPDVTAPKRRRRGYAGSGQTNKPKVIVFNASWCQPCKDMNSVIEKAKGMFGQKIDFQTVDVDDKENAKLVDEYDIGPVPTTVFLRADGEIGSFQIGYSGIDGMAKGMQSLLPVPLTPGAGPMAPALRRGGARPGQMAPGRMRQGMGADNIRARMNEGAGMQSINTP